MIDYLKMEIDRDKFDKLMFKQLQHHKTYCDDINCHLYLILARIMSEMFKKDLTLYKEDKNG